MKQLIDQLNKDIQNLDAKTKQWNTEIILLEDTIKTLKQRIKDSEKMKSEYTKAIKELEV